MRGRGALAGAVVVLALGLSFIGTEPVRACSCAGGGPSVRPGLESSTAAFIGEVVKYLGGSDLDGRYRARVERVVKGDIGSEIDFTAPSPRSSCSGPPSGRSGILLSTAPDGRLAYNSCRPRVSPEELIEAAKPLPPPAQGGPPVVYVTTQSREARILAIDARGRVVARAPGTPDPYAQVASCPGGDRIAVATREEPRLTIHDSRTLAVVSERTLPPSGPIPLAFRCLARDGSEVLVAALSPGGRDGTAAVVVHGVTGSTTTWEGEASMAAVSEDGASVAVAVVGSDGFEVDLVDLRTRASTNLGTLDLRPVRMTMAGSRVLTLAGTPDGSAGHVVLSAMTQGRRPTRTPIAATHGEFFVFADGRVGVPTSGGNGRELQVFDERLRLVGTWPDAAATWRTFALGDFVVSSDDVGHVRVADLAQPGGAAVLADLRHITNAVSVFPAPEEVRATSEPITPPGPAEETKAPGVTPTTVVAVPLAPIPVAVPPDDRGASSVLVAVAAAAVLAAVAIATGVQTRRRGARR